MEFQVNQYATGDQYYPAVATLSDGRFVVTWDTEGKDGSGKAVVARVYSAQADPEGDEFVVNTYTDGDQAVPELLGLADGRFLAVWQSTGQDGSYHGIFGQLFNVDGGKQGGEFQANTYVQDTQAGASSAMVNNGGFLVTWDGGHAQDGSGYGVFGQMYDGVGAKNGGEFQINTFFSDSQMHSSLAALPGGGFISSWMSKGQDGDGFGVFAQVSEADGSKKGNEFQLNSHTDGDQDYPRIGVFADGRFVSVWESDGQDGDGWGVFAQRHEATGADLGEEFQVNSLSAGDQRGPVVATLAADRFVAVWSGEGSGDDIGLHGQLFDSAGAKIGQPFVVNGQVSGWQSGTALSVFANGSFIVAWTSDGQDGDGRGIFAQRFNPDGTKKYK